MDGIQELLNPSNLELLIGCFDRWNQDSKLNFADYLFLRKSNLAWKECSAEDGLGARNVNCALHYTSPTKIMQNVEAKEAAELANMFATGYNAVGTRLNVI